MGIQTEVVRGRPIRAGGQRLVPVVERTVGRWRRATIGRGIDGRGGGLVRLRPIGVVVGAGEEEQFTPIPDETRRILRRFLLAGVLVMLLSVLVGWMADRGPEEDQDGE
ncbi:MAG TPA: hypothetical protein EYH27_03245 [Anaerolineales bacterium]|nr:hypothetical protein [Anaerolineales bacterium]